MAESGTHLVSHMVLDHAYNPRNLGPLEDADGHARVTGPCGDTMEFWLTVRNGRVEKIAFTTDGCGSSLACGSMATCLARGRSVADASAVTQADILEALGGLPEDTRHCALLAANVLRAACEDFSSKSITEPGKE